MSPPICLIERASQGDAIERVTLTGERLEESWTPEASMGVSERPRAAARWVSQIVTNHADRALALVCLDASGSFASWTRPTTRDPRVVETVIRQSEGESLVGVGAEMGSFEESSRGEGLVGPDLTTPGGGVFQVLLEDEPEGMMARAAVLAVRDPAASLFLDELDALGVRVQAVDSIWHLIASAWDPATPLREHADDGEMIVASDAPLSVVCVLDDGGMLVWSWTRGGRLVAAGQIRVPARDGEVHLREGSLARLNSDWLAWSGQLGTAPRRVVFIAPRGADDDISAQTIRDGLSRALPQATVDLALVEDPLGETCRRVAGYRGEAISPPSDPSRSLVSLANRPSRVHRGMHRWLAVGLLVLAVLAAVGASALFEQASAYRASAKTVRDEQMRVYQSTSPPEPASGQTAVFKLEEMVLAAETALKDGGEIPPPRPILEELDTLLFVLSLYYNQGLELEFLEFGGFLSNRVVVSVEETSVYEELIRSLNNMDSAIDWAAPNQRTVRNRIEVTLTGGWR